MGEQQAAPADHAERKPAAMARPDGDDGRYRLLVERGRDVIALHAPDGRYRYVSPSAESVSGFAPADLIGGDPFAYVHPDDAPHLREHVMARLLAGEIQESVRYRFRQKNGGWTWLESLAVPVHDNPADPSQVTALITSSRDVTAAVDAERELRANEHRLRLALRTARLGMYEVQLPGHGSYFSDEHLAIFGYGPEHRCLFESGWEPLVHPEDALTLHTVRSRARAGRLDAMDIELRRMHREGRWIWLRVVGRATEPDASGRPTRWLATIQDIDQRRRDEAQILESRARLRQAQAIARLGDWRLEAPSLRHRWSDEAFHVLGYEPGECAPSLQAFLARVHPDDVDRMSRMARGIEQSFHDADEDTRIVLPGGELRHVHLHIRVARDEQGRVTGLTGTVQDVTERKLAELELREARDRLRELSSHHEDVLNAERKRIAMDVHDEVGQMLTAMKLQLDLLQSQLGDKAPAQQAAEGLRGLIEDTIEVTRNVALILRPAALDLGLMPALEWLAEDFSLRSEVPCRVESNVGEVALGEKASIELFRIAQESLTNVARHARASQVRLLMRRSGDALEMSIVDDGCGFDPEQAQAGGHFGLLGMRERALRVGASLLIDSASGRGATICVRMPSAPPAAPARQGMPHPQDTSRENTP
jgi:PAS domain S-box-containing protein